MQTNLTSSLFLIKNTRSFYFSPKINYLLINLGVQLFTCPSLEISNIYKSIQNSKSNPQKKNQQQNVLIEMNDFRIELEQKDKNKKDKNQKKNQKNYLDFLDDFDF
ncbi:hypothetical protein M0811_04386 [Anaeramoeba ignava]|uniref:Uncharacterized protein n=1 Tax=Anaeramoeba ignava TaxID=1746090 RepID=A0A9Q0LWV6_ANAIG|nr:hypothetical protein M0811_04386 [Anaeramoeba ignava]